MNLGATVMVAAASASYLAILAAENVFSGERSDAGSEVGAVEKYFRRMESGDQGFADLDLITLALEQTGGDALATLVMFDVLDGAGQFFAEL